ncbi:SRPBCC domain-containing protein [Cryomorphaceae bacterium 1068]|nr:SRPBCC domain-containing protein [Cryomorphaceae bacterium 1068]
MAKELFTSIQIKASKELVWKVLTDFDKYPEWNPLITSLKGEVAAGKRITAKVAGTTFKPEVLVFEENIELKWLGHLWIKGLFDGEHRFLLTENKDGVCFEQSEKFGGILVPLFAKSLDGKIKTGFEEMNIALKRRVEEIQGQ